jgi:hypothetical protein
MSSLVSVFEAICHKMEELKTTLSWNRLLVSSTVARVPFYAYSTLGDVYVGVRLHTRDQRWWRSTPSMFQIKYDLNHFSDTFLQRWTNRLVMKTRSGNENMWETKRKKSFYGQVFSTNLIFHANFSLSNEKTHLAPGLPLGRARCYFRNISILSTKRLSG